MSRASDQITEYLSVGGLFNPELMNQYQHEAVRDTLVKARDDIQSLERWNAALREQVEALDAKWKMAEDQCFDQVGKIGELQRENAVLREQIAALGEIACLNLDDATVAKCDAVTGGEKYRDVMHRLFVEQPKELAALRNEVARLSNRTQWLCTCGGSKASA